MELNNEIRLQAYRNATPVQQYLFGNFDTGQILVKIGKKYSNSNDTFLDNYIVLVGDTILGFFKINDVIPLLQQELDLDLSAAEKLGAEVLEFLAPLSDPDWQPPLNENSETTLVTNEPVATVSTLSVQEEGSDESMHESVAIPEIRTMAGDMAHERTPDRSTFNAAADFEEPAYVSTQPIIEKKVTDVPSFSSPQYSLPKPDSPATDSRWN